MTSPRMVNIFGPPGAGKTHQLLAMFQKAVKQHSPARVGVLTYTRAAADEVRERACDSLGILTPKRTEKVLPWVGTIHSLCFRRLGLSQADLVTGKVRAEFARDMQVEAPADRSETLWLDEPFQQVDSFSKIMMDSMLRASSAAAHRKISFPEALRYIPQEEVEQHGPDQLEWLYGEYVKWKRVHGLYDYEDLLLAGREIDLPVDILFCDEAQDNSPLLWDVINNWGRHTKSFILAGDPWQALYSFSGADPALFLRQPGKWFPILKSRRLDPRSAKYAKNVLRYAGLADPSSKTEAELLQWYGGRLPDAPRRGGTVYLARTHALTTYYSDLLYTNGVPYTLRRGKAPLQTKGARVYRYLLDLESGVPLNATEALSLIEVLGKSRGAGRKRLIQHLKDDQYGQFFLSDLASVGGIPAETFLALIKQSLPDCGYFDDVYQKYGRLGITQTPETQVSTIHGYKGKEADNVVLGASWGTLPAKSILRSEEGRRSEGCVAYVGVSRHRFSLEIDRSNFSGVAYPWP